MKIAFALSPEVDLLDLFTLVEPIKLMKMPPLKPHGLELDFCSATEIPDELVTAMQTQLINPAIVPTLADYDLVVVPGNLPTIETSMQKLNAWLETISDKAVVMATGSAVPLMRSIGSRPATHFFTAGNRFEVICLGIKLAKYMAGKDSASEVAERLGVPFDLAERAFIPARQAVISRKTKETSIDLDLNLDGSGSHDIETGIPFFDHMLTQIAVHGLFDLSIHCKGDLEIDPHHSVEDVALTLGKAFDQALGDRKGLVRMASATVPMDESLAQVTIDLSGRPYAVIEVDWQDLKVGDLPVTLVTHFLESFATQARCNLSVRLLAGGDDHHRAEAIFKAMARALDASTQIDPRRLDAVPSSKGVI